MNRGMLIALTPLALASIFFFRLPALLLLIVSVVSAVIAEYVYCQLTGKKIPLKDLSAVITGLLLGLSLSPSTPLYVAAAGSVVGIVVGKQLFGGFGRNLLNPALTGRLFIVYAFPGVFSPWKTPFDLATTATPLGGEPAGYISIFLGNIPGSIGETSALLLLLGGGYLIYKKYANWRIPVSILATVIIISILTGENPFFHVLSGSLLLGAFFMATDPVTSPKSQSGRFVFGVGIGFIVMAMRLWGWLPEGTTFAILGMNLVVPAIDKYLNKNKPKKT